MKLEWADSLTQLYHGDATQLDQIKDHSIDMILTDPPYGIDYVTGHRMRQDGEKPKPSPKSKVHTLERFDPISHDEHFPGVMLSNALYEFHRVLKDDTAIYMFTRWDCYHKLLPLFKENAFKVKNVITWAKNNWTAGDLEGNYGYQTEIILFAVIGKHKLLGPRATNLMPFKRVDGAKLLHPAQKPESLLSFLITKSCPPGGIVLDPFVGCGSTCVAAASVGRKSIGVDLNREWLPIARKRLEKKVLPLIDGVTVAPKNFTLYLDDEGEVDVEESGLVATEPIEEETDVHAQ